MLTWSWLGQLSLLPSKFSDVPKLVDCRLARDNWFQLEALSDYFGLIRLNPSIINAGRAVLDMGGYPIESPIERNW